MDDDFDIEVALEVFHRFGIDKARVDHLEVDEVVFVAPDYASHLVREELVAELMRVLGRQVYVLNGTRPLFRLKPQ